VERNGAKTGSVAELPQLRTLALLAVTVITLYLCWLIGRPFLAVVIWAMALAILGQPWHRWLGRHMPPNLAALLAVASVAIVVVAPALWLVEQLFKETTATLQLLGPRLNSDFLGKALLHYPWLARILERLQENLNLDQEIRNGARALASKFSALLGNSVWLVAQLSLTFVSLFFFFRDKKQILDLLRRFTPLSDSETSALFDRVSQTISACLYGNVVVKLVQGILGGLMFWILGLPAPVLAGGAMAFFAMVPVIGSALVWGPAAISLALGGSWGKALVLALWGAFVVSLIDNVLYPMLVAGELRLHTLAVFFSILGGLIAFGPVGVVLGPIVLAMTGELLEVWRLKSLADSSRLDSNQSRQETGRIVKKAL
jgi:predicted PurR-regulated permease PerM